MDRKLPHLVLNSPYSRRSRMLLGDKQCNALRPDSTLLFLMVGMRRTHAGLAAVQALRIAVLNQSYEDFWAYRQGLIV
jgi:hypothetical protein